MAIDPSYLELGRAIILPFTEEFSEGWRAVRIICFGLLFSALILLIMTYFVLSPEQFGDAHTTIKKVGLLALACGSGLYVACAVHAYLVHRGRLSDRDSRYRSYED